MPAVFAIADKVIQDPQTATFAAFGCIAQLVLVEFTGPWRTRLTWQVGLAVTGAVLLSLGTLCSRNAWLAAGAMAIVGFTILFSGVLNGYLAVAGTAAMLPFILPVSTYAPASTIPARLAGWGLASGASVCAVMLLWPNRAVPNLRGAAARATRALADLLEARLHQDSAAVEERAGATRDAIVAFRRQFFATPYRPAGATGSIAALAALLDELDWLLAFVMLQREPEPLDLCREENAELVKDVVEALRVSAARLEGATGQPDLARLDEAQKAVAGALAERLRELPPSADDATLVAALEPSFRVRGLSYGAREIVGYALLATGTETLDLEALTEGRWLPAPSFRRSVLLAIERLVSGQEVGGSVWVRNSVRGAIGLAIAVFIAQQIAVQHAFWVVLGTLSVLRSTALGTGATIVRALVGTGIGILIGSGLVIAIGTRVEVLWAVLPIAVLLAAYAPRAISFIAGQAAFTIVLFVLFNIIQPVGWTVGLVRIEDVAIGFAVSLFVGVLFWPRGAATLLRRNLATAYTRGAEYVGAATRQLVSGSDPSRSLRAGKDARLATVRLGDALRQYLAEGSRRDNLESLGALAAGANRVRTAAQSLSSLAGTDGSSAHLPCATVLDGQINAVRSWYVTLAASLADASEVPPPTERDADQRSRVLRCVRDAIASGDRSEVAPALTLLWAAQHLDILRRLEPRLGRYAASL
jgi:uncharacterized membrane protein YccC